MTAEEFLPRQLSSLRALRAAAAKCQGCDLFERATQTVFGAGPNGASIVLVGEQPGDAEDRQGVPFVGPAGRLLDQALDEAGILRQDTYLTNAVKHFKWEPRGKVRLHKNPSAREVAACRPWLAAELDVVRPRLVVCLGATASKALLGSGFRVTQQRGEFFPGPSGTTVMATVHPSAILRIREGSDRETAYESLVADLRRAASWVRAPPEPG
jgi:uracil-DNA glycosylase